MNEQQIRTMVTMNIIDNCTMEFDNREQEKYSLDEQQFGKCIDTLVKNINVIHCLQRLTVITDVSQQRELLLAFAGWLYENLDKEVEERIVDDYLNSK